MDRSAGEGSGGAIWRRLWPSWQGGLRRHQGSQVVARQLRRARRALFSGVGFTIERERGRERVIERERTIRSVARSDESGESIVENERTNERTSKRTNERNELRTYTKHGKWWLAIVLRGRKNRLLFSSALTFSPFGGFGELYTRISRGAGTLEIDVMFHGNTSAA